MYTIINSDFMGFDENKSCHRVDIVCDTADNLPSAEEIEKRKFTTGSFAWLMNERTFKVLNHEKEWV